MLHYVRQYIKGCGLHEGRMTLLEVSHDLHLSDNMRSRTSMPTRSG